MNKFEKALNEINSKISIGNEEIDAINKRVEKEKSIILKEIKELIFSGDAVFDTEKLSMFKREQLLNVFFELSTKRNLLDEEFSNSILRMIELETISLKDKAEKEKVASGLFQDFKKSVESLFESLDDKRKFKIAMFCSGLTTISNEYDVMKEFIKEKFGLANYSYENDKNNLKIEGYWYELSEAAIHLVTVYNNTDGLKEIAEKIISIYEHGYKSGISTKNENYDVFEISIIENDESKEKEVLISEKITRLNKNVLKKYKSEENCVKDALVKAMTYMANNQWSYNHMESECEYDD